MTFATTYTQCSWSNTWIHCTINFNIVHQEICCDTVLMAHISTLPLCGFGNPTSRHTILMSPFWTTDGHWVIMLNLHFLESSKAKRLYSSLPLLSTSWVNLQPPRPRTSLFFITPSKPLVWKTSHFRNVAVKRISALVSGGGTANQLTGSPVTNWWILEMVLSSDFLSDLSLLSYKCMAWIWSM